MKVSVVTVTWNSAATLRDTLESVLAQTYCDIEHIIVDGGAWTEQCGWFRNMSHAIMVGYGISVNRIEVFMMP